MRIIMKKIKFVGRNPNPKYNIMHIAIAGNIGSGKTFTSANLAMSLAIKKKKTIVVDLDMRKASLSKFATNVLNQNTDMDVAIKGYTDNQGWKNSTAAESQQKNLDLSQVRAQSVQSYLLSCGVQAAQITSVEGLGEANPVASNATKEGQQQNRRVEVYLYASPEMIQAAEAGTLQ